jgi:hypothetical protein
VALERSVGTLGFQYAGHTGSASKANTNFNRREICINADLEYEEAALSFAYELANAAQQRAFEMGPLRLWKEGAADHATAERYAEGILRREANSVLMRSKVAIAIGRENLIANQAYNHIARDVTLNDAQKVEATFEEMKSNGYVNRGKTLAWEHYIAQYLAHKGKGADITT